jgi:putative ABC transport system permease protein
MRGRWWLIPYDVKLALVSLRRDPALSLAMFVCLALGAGMWTAITCHYLRDYALRPQLAPGLSQVEIEHPRALALFEGTSYGGAGWHPRVRVSYPEYEALAGHALSVRQTGTFRAPLLLTAAGHESGAAGPAESQFVRFVEPAFFDLFALPLARGAAFTSAEADAPVAVIGPRLARALFKGDALGRTVVIEGQPFRVVAELAEEQVFRPEWDLSTMNARQDAIYVPISWGRRLDVWPERLLMQTPLSSGAGQLWQSDALFVTFWIDLPTVADRSAYQRHLRRVLPARHQVRDRAAWLAAFPIPASDIYFYSVLLAVALLGAGFTTTRLLLAKGLARAEVMGIYRALGATRVDLFNRQLLEGALIALPAALAGAVLAALLNLLFNRIALQNDIPIVLSPLAALLGIVPSFLMGVLAAAYPAWRISRTPPTVAMGRL